VLSTLKLRVLNSSSPGSSGGTLLGFGVLRDSGTGGVDGATLMPGSGPAATP
jgi:hypothetical protein